jgi:hypothetical protein
MDIQGRRLALSSFAWLACQLAATDRADAQLGTRPIQGPSRPTTSPYLGLLNNGGNSPGLNYYTQVRPQRQLRAGAAALQQEIRDVQEQVDAGVVYDEQGVPLLPQSGHKTGFLNQRGYFGTGPSSSFSPGTGAVTSKATRGIGQNALTRPANGGRAGGGGRPNVSGMGSY